MSRVYFHTEHDGTAELRGSERAWAGKMCTDIAAGMVPDWVDQLEPRLTPRSPLRQWLEPEKAVALPRWVRTLLSVDREPLFQHDGEPLESFDLVLNTALVMGSEPVCLLARLHGQCELHAYVEGPERSWLADLIEQGRASGVMRASQGWEDVVKLLRLRDNEPVVTSYSVTNGFPNGHVADWQPPYEAENDEDAAWDQWYELSDAEQWRLSLLGLRANPEQRRRLLSEDLRVPFGHSRSMLDLFA